MTYQPLPCASKRAYASRFEAETVLARTRAAHSHHLRTGAGQPSQWGPASPIRVYLCTYCSKWHLTSKAKRPA